MRFSANRIKSYDKRKNGMGSNANPRTRSRGTEILGTIGQFNKIA